MDTQDQEPGDTNGPRHDQIVDLGSQPPVGLVRPRNKEGLGRDTGTKQGLDGQSKEMDLEGTTVDRGMESWTSQLGSGSSDKERGRKVGKINRGSPARRLSNRKQDTRARRQSTLGLQSNGTSKNVRTRQGISDVGVWRGCTNWK
ncbi:unnamed protein product [Ilex paraguariensis]|uniref:Uncharacterized protein n=1 Tax=Ilex paraguariensis TaxID=185542 RepID=A0ABC8TAZ6_9AQUA